jgi:hypothetical protein
VFLLPGPEYGSGGVLGIDRLRKEDFPQLFCPTVNQAGLVYLDHAGATLSGKTQLQRTMEVRSNEEGNIRTLKGDEGAY